MILQIDSDGKIHKIQKGFIKKKNLKRIESTEGGGLPVSDKFDIIEIPDQDLSNLRNEDDSIEGIYPDDVRTFSAEKEAQIKLRGQTYVSIAEIDTSRTDKKYLKVEKTIDENNYSVWAYADYSLLLAYQNNDLAIGDIVIIEFVDNELDKAYAQGKIVGF